MTLSAISQKPLTGPLRVLALGDSYMAGEGAPEGAGCIDQAGALLKEDGILIGAPRILAVPGWTCADLVRGIAEGDPGSDFDAVVLLIGVNDQYRGYPVNEYAENMELILRKAIGFAGDRPGNVIVVSIPDWAVTPFARNDPSRDSVQIAAAIDSFNRVNRDLSGRYGSRWIDITSLSRRLGPDPAMIAPDGLHPSALQYGLWARMLVPLLEEILQSGRNGIPPGGAGTMPREIRDRTLDPRT